MHLRDSTVALWVVSFCVLLGGMTLAYPRTALDSPTFTYVADTVLDGGAPYRDAWDVKGLGVHITFALSIVLFGKSALGLRIFYLLWLAATALVVVAITRHIYHRPQVSLLAGFLFLILNFTPGYWHHAQPDGFLSLPLAIGVLLALLAMRHDHWAMWIGSAAAIGVAAGYKLPMGLVGLSALWAAFRTAPSGGAHVLRRWALLALGLMGPASLIWMFLAYRGALWDFFVSQFIVAWQYAALWRSLFSFRCFVENVLNPDNVPLLVSAGLVAVHALRNVRRKMEGSQEQIVLAIWAGLALLVLVAHGVYLAYHFLPLTPPIAILSAVVAFEFWERRSARPALRHALLLLCLASVALVPVVRFAQNARFTASALENGNTPPPPWRAVAEWIHNESSPRDTIFVWGNMPAIYIDSDRRSATRFCYAMHLTHPWRGIDLRGLFLQELLARPPLFFVLVKPGDVPRCAAATTRDEFKAYQTFPELRSFVDQNYRLEFEDPQLFVFRRTHVPPRP